MTTDQTKRDALNRILADLAENGGGTYERGTLLPFRPDDGYAVGVGGIHLPANIFTAEAVGWSTKAVGSEYDTSYVGTWQEGNTVYIDAVVYIKDRTEAMLRGMQEWQTAIYSFAEAKSIFLDEQIGV